MSAAPTPGRMRRRLPVIVVWAAAVAYACVASYFALRRHDQFLTGIDLSIPDQAFWLLANGHEPFVTQHMRNYLGDHFGLLTLAFVPAYRLGGGAELLLVSQAALVALTAPLLYAFARARGADPWLAALPAVLWVASPLTMSATLFDFHGIPVAAPLIVGSILAVERRRYVLFAVLALLACLAKEDVPLLYVMLGIVLVLEGRRRIGLITVAAAAAVFAFAVGVFIPHFSDSLEFFARRFGGARGDSLTEVAWWMARHPLDAAADLFTGQNLLVVGALVVTTGGLCLLAPRWLLLGVPALAHNLLSAAPLQHELDFHYHFPVALGFAVAGAAGVATLRRRGRWVRRASAVTVGVALALAPLSVLYGNGESDPGRDRKQARRQALSLVPDGASVAASGTLMPHLGHRVELYALPLPFLPADVGGDLEPAEIRDRRNGVEYVVWDTSDALLTASDVVDEQTAALPAVLASLGFVEEARYDSIRVYRRLAAGG